MARFPWKIDNITMFWLLTSRLWRHNAGARELFDQWGRSIESRCMVKPMKRCDAGLYSPMIGSWPSVATGLLPDTENCGLRMRRECRERFPRHRLQRKPLVSDPDMHHGSCVTHVSWCMAGSLTRGGGENVPGIPGACVTRNVAYLVRSPWTPCPVMAIVSRGFI